MSNSLKNLLLVAGGFAAGFLIARKITADAWEQLLEDELAEMRASSLESQPLEEDDEIEKAKIPRGYIPEKPYTAYNTITTVVEEKPTIDELIQAKKEERTIPLASGKRYEEPYLISVGEFTDEEKDWEKTTLVYYGGDDVLTTEENSIIHEKVDWLGSNVCILLEDDDVSDNPIYVRNPMREEDFEVAIEPGAYSEVVLGIDEQTEESSWRGKGFADEQDE